MIIKRIIRVRILFGFNYAMIALGLFVFLWAQ